MSQIFERKARITGAEYPKSIHRRGKRQTYVEPVLSSRLSERNFLTNFCSLLPHICSFNEAFGAESAQLRSQNGAFWQLNRSLRQAARVIHFPHGLDELVMKEFILPFANRCSTARASVSAANGRMTWFSRLRQDGV
jgi:hypothetical protein